MQCSNCKSTDLEKSVYDYYICKNCGNINYGSSNFGKKKNPLNEYYFVAVLGVIVTIVVVLVLLLMTALSRKNHIEQVIQKNEIQAEINKPLPE
jgi:heme exporter protein D